ncbi:MAG: caspase family protein, partial [Hyphomicrobiales bacterium]|nr:caspase family protein [Hyphomicrobiales bacterium]
MPTRLVVSALALAMLLVSSAIASAQDRLALIIGNSKYQSLPSLANPSFDTEAIGSLLTTAGFDVT